MKELKKLLLYMFGYTLIIATGILIMIYGWGLKPENWWWVILGNVFGLTFARAVVVIAESKDT
jgi:uncharacterized membrane protein HdeD (DUF308 family)